VLNLGITPVLYVIVKGFELRGKGRNGRAATDGRAGPDIVQTAPEQPTPI
jgi:formate hydrogenlyase subunit 4